MRSSKARRDGQRRLGLKRERVEMRRREEESVRTDGEDVSLSHESRHLGVSVMQNCEKKGEEGEGEVRRRGTRREKRGREERTVGTAMELERRREDGRHRKASVLRKGGTIGKGRRTNELVDSVSGVPRHDRVSFWLDDRLDDVTDLAAEEKK